jgi:hypothetical protein
MNTMRAKATAAVTGIRRHPGRALAACVALAAVSVFTGTTVASAHPAPTLAVSKAELHAAPAPLVDNFDTNLTGAHVKAYKHAYAVPVQWNVDGCDHDYGQPGQCVPWEIPASTPRAACAWLKSNGFGPLKVYGTNRQNLPENAQGYVCAGTS